MAVSELAQGTMCRCVALFTFLFYGFILPLQAVETLEKPITIPEVSSQYFFFTDDAGRGLPPFAPPGLLPPGVGVSSRPRPTVSALYHHKSTILWADSEGVGFFDIIKKKVVRGVDHGFVGFVHPDGMLIVGRRNGDDHLELFESPDHKSRKRFPCGKNDWLRWSPSGNFIWTFEEERRAGVPAISTSVEYRILKLMKADGGVLCRIRAAKEVIVDPVARSLADSSKLRIVFSTDERIVATNVGPTLWEVRSGKVVVACKAQVVPGAITWMAFSKNDESLALLEETFYYSQKDPERAWECRLLFWNVKSGDQNGKIKLCDEPVIGSIETSPDHSLIAYGTERRIGVIEFATRRELFSLKVEERVSCIAFSPDSKYMAFGCGRGQVARKDGEFTLVNVSQPRNCRRIHGLDNNITALAFLDNNTIAVGDAGGKVTVWKIR